MTRPRHMPTQHTRHLLPQFSECDAPVAVEDLTAPHTPKITK